MFSKVLLGIEAILLLLRSSCFNSMMELNAPPESREIFKRTAF